MTNKKVEKAMLTKAKRGWTKCHAGEVASIT